MAEQTLLLRADDIPRLTKLSGNIDIDILTPYIYTAQKNEIRRILGIPLYNKILIDFENDELTGLYLNIYEDFIVDMLVYYSVATFTQFGSYQISNGGIYRHVPENSESVDISEVNTLISRFQQLGAAIELVFVDWIKDNPVPEYTKSCNSGNSFKLNWFLD
jgi:hypothetical protein